MCPRTRRARAVVADAGPSGFACICAGLAVQLWGSGALRGTPVHPFAKAAALLGQRTCARVQGDHHRAAAARARRILDRIPAVLSHKYMVSGMCQASAQCAD